jgi:hypothetical protein
LRRWKHAKKYRGEGEKAGVDVSSSVLSLMTVPIAVIVGYSRVELGYHTIEQVVAGAAIGLMFGSMWFLVTTRVFAKQFSELVKEDDDHASNSEKTKIWKVTEGDAEHERLIDVCEPVDDFEREGGAGKFRVSDERCRRFVKYPVLKESRLVCLCV